MVALILRWCVCWLLLGAAQAAPLQLAGSDALPLAPHIQILAEPAQPLSLEQVRSATWQARFHAPPPGEIPVLGSTSTAYWVRFELARGVGDNAEWVLEQRAPSTDHLDFYWPDAHGVYQHQQTGDTRPFAERPVAHRHFVLPLSVGSTPQTYYLRVASINTLALPLYATPVATFHAADQHVLVLFGISYGIFVAMIFYNLFLWLSLRSPDYLYYVWYSGALGLLMVTVNGVGYQWLWPGSPTLQNMASWLLQSQSLAAVALFARSLLEARQRFPRLDRVLLLGAGSALLLSLATVFWSRHLLIGHLISLTSVVIVPTVIIIAVSAWRRGSRAAGLFLLAFGVLFSAVMLLNLRNYGVLPMNFFTSYSLQIGAAVESVLLSFALAERIAQLRRDKSAAQRALLEASRRAEQELEQKVAERTRELSATNAELEDTVMKLAELNHQKNDLLHIVAHDLKTPLTAINLSLSGMAAQSPAGQERRGRMQEIQSTVGYMMQIVGNLLSGRAVAAGRPDLALATVDMSALVEQVAAHFQERALAKNIRLTCQVPTAITAWGNAVAVREILENLLSNAVKYTPPGLAVQVCLEDGTDWVRLAVADQGPGLTADDQARVFQRFSRLSARPTAGEESTGLGLSIVKKLVETLRGRVWVSSTPGVGAEFIVELPRQAAIHAELTGG